MIGGRTNSSSTPRASCSDLEYGTHGTSGGSDIENESKSPSDILSDAETSENEDGHPTELYQAYANEIDDMEITNIYAESTTRQLDSVESHWRKYCEQKRYDPVEKMRNISSGTVSDFFLWRLGQKKGEKGRRLRGTKSASSFDTYRKMFLRVYRRLTGKDMDSEMSRKTLRVTKLLTEKLGLSHQPGEKPSMDVEDVLEIIRTTLTTTKKMFQVGRYRIQTCFFMQGGFITANRPRALLGLRYKDVKVTVLRDPNGGPHNILIELTYNFTKSYLGAKPSNTFKIPEIIFDPSLCMSPHVFLLGLMFADNVFSNPHLTPERLFELDIRPECNELVVPFNDTAKNLLVFRRYEKTASKRTISNEGLPYHTMRTDMKDIGEIAGFKEIARPYCLRYGSGNAFDKDGNISENMRNMILNHSNSKVFLNHYASRNLKVDTQAIVRGTKPQEELIQAACRMSRSIDPDRPRSLTKEQKQSIDEDPSIQKLRKKLEKRKRRSQDYTDLQKRIRNEKQQKSYALMKRIRKDYDSKRAEEDIQRQLSGQKFEQKIKTDLNQYEKRTQEHKELITSLMSLPGSSLEEETQRRIQAITAVTKYCRYEEGGMPRNHIEDSWANYKPQETDGKGHIVIDDKTAIEKAKEVFVKEKRPTICFMCLGNESLTTAARIHCFSRPGDVSKHFKKVHLKYFKEGIGEECTLCGVHLKTLHQMQRHAFELHGTVSNSFQ